MTFAKAKSPTRPVTPGQRDYLIASGKRVPDTFQEAAEMISDMITQENIAIAFSTGFLRKKDNSVYRNNYDSNGEGMWGDFEYY